VTTETLDLFIVNDDIAAAQCGNRARCLLALAVDRQFELAGKGYVRVDANELAFNFEGRRWRYHLPKRAVKYLRRWDELGAQLGLEAAREQFQPARFELLLAATSPIAPKGTRARKDRVNYLRNQKSAAARAAGQTRSQPAPRYVGI
jgi:hypothetical protein